MNLTSKPPLIAPPPFPARDDSRSRWLIAAAAAVGILLGLVLMGFVFTNFNGINGNSNGAEDVIAVSLSGEDTDTHTRNPPSEKVESDDASALSGGFAAANEVQAVETTGVGNEVERSEEIVSASNRSASAKDEDEEERPRTFALEVYKAPLIPAASGKMDSGAVTTRVKLESGPNPFIGDGKWTSTVFVIDRSGSMSGWNNFHRVVASLSRALAAMKDDQSFTVILFDEVAYPFDGSNDLLKANSDNKRRITEWLNGTQPDGGTDPSDAMYMAIELSPERIVVLSDGEFDPLVVNTITLANQFKRKGGRIDCIGLSEDVETLRELAHQNKGIYYQAQ